MRIKNTIPFLFILTALSTASWSFAGGEYLLPKKRTPRKARLYMSVSAHSYYSNANYTSAGGVYTYLYDRNRRPAFVALADWKVGLGYSPAAWIEIYPYAQAQTHYSRPYFLPLQPVSAGFKLRHKIKTRVISLYPEIDASLPLFSQTGEVSKIVTSDGVAQITPSVWLYFSYFKSLTPFFRVGFQHKLQGFAGLFLWQAGVSYQDYVWEAGVLAGGFQTVVGDVDEIQPSRRHRVLEKFNSGSLKFYSVNPSLVGVSLWADMAVSKKANLFLNFNYDFQGVNYAKGFGVNLGVKYKFLSKKSKRKRSIRRFTEKRKNFEEETLENTNEDLELMKEIENLR